MLFVFLALLQAAPLVPVLPAPSVVFDAARADSDIMKLCGSENRRCVETQQANITILRERYEAKTTTPEQKVKLLSIIDGERSRGPLDWMIVRTAYTQWLEATGALPKPSYPVPARNSTRCVSRMSGGVYTSECTSY